MINRSSGILMHISSLAGDYGIGDFGKEAYTFVNFLAKSKQKNWQILPLGITSFGDSPYQCFSAFAGNPYFIDLDELIIKDYLTKSDLDKYKLGKDPNRIDYGLLYKNKMALLRIAYKNAKKILQDQLNDYYLLNMEWLRSFSLFMALKKKHDNKSWFYWEEAYRKYNSPEVLEFEAKNQDEVFFWVFTQYLFESQWKKLKEYANEKAISIIGDLPIYVAEDSADIWRNPELFNLDEKLMPLTVAGCPPDSFTSTGQLWGNPIYNWKAMEEQEYKWWIDRIGHSFKQIDILRIDHFRGFESYWEVEYGSKNAINGQWVMGPGIKLFDKIKEELGDLNIIVEDLGFNTKEVREMVEATGFPNMKVLQFAFNPEEESEHMPHSFNSNSVVYTGTHDNHTIMEWLKLLEKEEFQYLVKYLKLNYDEGLNWGLIRGAWASVANLAIAPMQDFLALGDEARMNNPGTIGNNWLWRIDKEQLNEELEQEIKNLTEIYWR